MKNLSAGLLKSQIFAAALGLLTLASVAHAADVVRYKARPNGSSVRIDGAANVHNWDMEGSIISGFVELPAGVVLDSSLAAVAGLPANGKIPIHAEARMPVTSIKSHSEGMDEVMQQAMDATNSPYIEYHLAEMTLKQPHEAGKPFEFDATGELSLHGVTNKITMPVTIETVDKTKLKIVGNGIPIDMTDYGVKPPVKLALFITKPGVKISFEWIVGLPKSVAK
jgi:YceI-like domain